MYRAQLLGKDISEEEEVTYNAKKDTKSRNQQPGTRGINFWRVNETPKPWTEPWTEPFAYSVGADESPEPIGEADPMDGKVPEDATMGADAPDGKTRQWARQIQ